jgi:Fur family iron response transcriptional regulator
MTDAKYASTLLRLKKAGLRPTRQRVALASLMFNGEDRHLTAEQLLREAQGASVRVSLATIYNALNQFAEAGLLREVVIEPGQSYFDTNIEDHHHFYVAGTGEFYDIPVGAVSLGNCPPPPDGMAISRIEVIIRLEPAGKA